LSIDIKEKCENANVPFFFKQWGGRNKKKEDRELLEQTWDDMPVAFGESK
jgi:protein gp37